LQRSESLLPATPKLHLIAPLDALLDDPRPHGVPGRAADHRVPHLAWGRLQLAVDCQVEAPEAGLHGAVALDIVVDVDAAILLG